MTTIDKKTLIEERVNTGLRGQWYPVAKSVEIKSDPTLWREDAGREAGALARRDRQDQLH